MCIVTSWYSFHEVLCQLFPSWGVSLLTDLWMFDVFCYLNVANITSLCFSMVRRILFLVSKFFASNELQRFSSWVTFRDLHSYLSLLMVHPSGVDGLDGVGEGVIIYFQLTHCCLLKTVVAVCYRCVTKTAQSSVTQNSFHLFWSQLDTSANGVGLTQGHQLLRWRRPLPQGLGMFGEGCLGRFPCRWGSERDEGACHSVKALSASAYVTFAVIPVARARPVVNPTLIVGGDCPVSWIQGGVASVGVHSATIDSYPSFPIAPTAGHPVSKAPTAYL